MEKLILAIDQGTTATTVLLIDSTLNVVGRASREILPTYPQYAWVEHDLDQIWDGTAKTIEDVLKKNQVNPSSIAAIGITNQRETVGAWEPITGKPSAKAIVWQCRRTAERCEKLRKVKGLPAKFKKKTGLVLDPYFSCTKIEWFLKNITGLAAKAKSGNALFGNIDTYLTYRLTGGDAFVTDTTNASRTGLMDLKSLKWDKELLKIFGVPESSLPKISSSSEIYGRTKDLTFLPDGIPIAGILGDQQAALFGQLCLQAGDSKLTYGTGAFLVTNTGEKIIYSKNGLLSTVAWTMNGRTSYALEGSAFVAGALVQWLRDELGIIKSSSEIEGLAREAKDDEMGDLALVPALTGLGAPHWNANARGLLTGITRGTKKAHIARAALEGIACQNDDLISALAQDLSKKKLNFLRVDGGASANNFLMQTQSDLAGIKIDRPAMLDTTALGAAMAAGLAVGIWKSEKELLRFWQKEKTFSPSGDKKNLTRLRNSWRNAIKMVNQTSP